MTIIFHLTTPEIWQEQSSSVMYCAASLEQEGFIHCSTTQQIVRVANTFYRGFSELVLLCIESQKLTSQMKWEPPAHPNPNNPLPVKEQEKFPHIYGTINRDAIIKSIILNVNREGLFELPNDIKLLL